MQVLWKAGSEYKIALLYGYTFLLHRKTKSTITWRCSSRCQARIITEKRTGRVIRLNTKHTHEPPTNYMVIDGIIPQNVVTPYYPQGRRNLYIVTIQCCILLGFNFWIGNRYHTYILLLLYVTGFFIIFFFLTTVLTTYTMNNSNTDI